MGIKLRAWDTYTKKMIFTGFHVLGEVTAFSAIEAYCYNNPSKELHLVRLLNDIILMLYIGKKDKNGIEIYSGDWIRCEQRGESIVVLQGYVFFHEDELCYCLARNGDEGEYERLFTTYNLEVVDNIYENPELIKVTK